MHVGEEIIIEPVQLVAGGDALARVDGLPIFVGGLYPGDRARVKITQRKKGFGRAEVLAILTHSPLRRSQPCPAAGECGGCDWTSLRLDAQLAAKQGIVTESLRRIGRLDPSVLPAMSVYPSPLNYRLRSRLHRHGDAVGFYAAGSNRVIPLPAECEVVGPLTARTYGSRDDSSVPSERAASIPLADWSSRESESGDDRDPDDIIPRDEIWEVGDSLQSGEQELVIQVERFRYVLSTAGFFQVNRHLLATLIRLVLAQATVCERRKTAVDLYAGAGFFTAPLASIFDDVVAVEGAEISHRFAARNVPGNVTLVNSPVERFKLPDADFVLIDPPRAGARPEVIDSIASAARERVCYLSCDPVTFARDAGRLTASGWRLASLALIDLFPNTHHVETLSSFERVP